VRGLIATDLATCGSLGSPCLISSAMVFRIDVSSPSLRGISLTIRSRYRLQNPIKPMIGRRYLTMNEFRFDNKSIRLIAEPNRRAKDPKVFRNLLGRLMRKVNFPRYPLASTIMRSVLNAVVILSS
jgi:hypothetical protein